MSEETSTYDKSVRIIRFSGKQSDWRIWSIKFLAYASVKGYRDILLGKVTMPATERNGDEQAVQA